MPKTQPTKQTNKQKFKNRKEKYCTWLTPHKKKKPNEKLNYFFIFLSQILMKLQWLWNT